MVWMVSRYLIVGVMLRVRESSGQVRRALLENRTSDSGDSRVEKS